LYFTLSIFPNGTRNIIDEIASVLNANADPGTNPVYKHINKALKAVVTIIDYYRSFLTRIGSNDLQRNSQTDCVRVFLNMIPSKIMGTAIYYTK
jgi:hypothetical protein